MLLFRLEVQHVVDLDLISTARAVRYAHQTQNLNKKKKKKKKDLKGRFSENG